MIFSPMIFPDKKIIATVVVVAGLMTGCAADLVLRSGEGSGADNGANICYNYTEAGLGNTCIKATAIDQWVYFSFGDAAEKTPADPAGSLEWDVAFQRFKIKMNGGVSGSGDAAAVSVAGSGNFPAVTQAVSEPYEQDKNFAPEDSFPDDACFNLDGVNYAFLNNFDSDKISCWFQYNSSTHVLTPTDKYYILKAANGSSFYKIKFISYYSETGTSAYIRFEWKAISSP